MVVKFKKLLLRVYSIVRPDITHLCDCHKVEIMPTSRVAIKVLIMQKFYAYTFLILLNNLMFTTHGINVDMKKVFNVFYVKIQLGYCEDYHLSYYASMSFILPSFAN